jgi:ketosteroid isomerase-like protein
MAAGPNDALWQAARESFTSSEIESLARLLMERGDPNVVQEYPQSGETFKGRDRIVEMNESYPAATGTQPTFALREFRASGDLAVIECSVDYGDGRVVSYVAVIQAADGRIVRMSEYFADPFPAPDWRKPFTAGA